MEYYLTLKGFIKNLQELEKTYGGNIPVLLADGASPNVMSPIVDSFATCIKDRDSGETMNMILVSNFYLEE